MATKKPQVFAAVKPKAAPVTVQLTPDAFMAITTSQLRYQLLVAEAHQAIAKAHASVQQAVEAAGLKPGTNYDINKTTLVATELPRE